MAEITWNQALNEFENHKERNETRYKNLLNEIETSSPTALTASDFNFYSAELNECNIREEDYTPNEVRRMMMYGYSKDEKHERVSSFDMLESFIDDETDSIFDFY